jgi:hypothetical protein
MKKRISLREMRFINCLGRYLHSSFNFYADEQSQDDILFFLQDFDLLYYPIEPSKNQAKYQNDNPWLFQPVTFFQSGKPISEVAWSDACYGFLSEKFNIQVMENETPTPETFETVLSNLLDKNGFVVLGVDDYYNDVKRQFYLKQHCRHSIVVDAINATSGEVSVIDDDAFYRHEYSITMETLKKMYFSDSAFKELLTFKSSGFRNDLDFEEAARKSDGANNAEHYSDGLMELYGRLDDTFLEYVLKGINFSISSKIIPHLTWRRNLSKRAKALFDFGGQRSNLLQSIATCWREIECMNKEVLQNGRSLADNRAQISAISEKLQWISEAEDRLACVGVS